MSVVGRVESLWRYPVKSMRGESLNEAFAGFSGVYGDRCYAFHSSGAPKGFPYLTCREQPQMLLFRARFRHPEQAAKPSNLKEAQALGSGVIPLPAKGTDFQLDVETPAGESLEVDDPKLIARLEEGLRERHRLTLLRSDRALTDCRPISLFSIQTARRLSTEVGVEIDRRRFRANIYLDLKDEGGFGEDGFLGGRLRIGSKTTIAVLERDARCKMITLDPDTGEANPEILKWLARSHEGRAGVYGAVLVEGTIRPGDPVELLA